MKHDLSHTQHAVHSFVLTVSFPDPPKDSHSVCPGQIRGQSASVALRSCGCSRRTRGSAHTL